MSFDLSMLLKSATFFCLKLLSCRAPALFVLSECMGKGDAKPNSNAYGHPEIDSDKGLKTELRDCKEDQRHNLPSNNKV